MNSSSRKVWSLTAGAVAAVLTPSLFSLSSAVAAPTTTANPVTQVAALPATQLLQSTLNRYATLTTLRLEVTRQQDTMTADKPQTSTITSTLIYAKPNKLRTVTNYGQTTMILVSDGTKVMQYAEKPGADAREDKAPDSVATLGSLTLLNLLGDAKARARFVTDKTTAIDKPGTTVEGVPCRVISFVGEGNYGNVEMAIGLKDGLAHRISCDFAPAIASLKGKPGALQKLTVTETYKNVRDNVAATDADFSTTLPAGTTLAPPPPPRKEPGSPVPIGQMSPDFSVTPVGATAPVKLSSFKGQVVLLDFWATWCPPCRKSLPETNRLNETYKDKGLKVLAISNEGADKVNPFIADNKYTFPVYLDTQNDAGKAYGIQAIPTFAIIDKEGKLAAFFVGLQEDGVIEAALKKAGLGAG